jgi:hypothetical protein
VHKKSKPFPRLSALLLAALLLGATLTVVSRGPRFRAQLTGEEGSSASAIAGLPPCRRIPALFPENRNDPEGRGWDEDFSRTVTDILDEMEDESPLSCTDDAKTLASPALQRLASRLPQWQDKQPLFASDVHPVLLDYLEAYGCALKEKGILLPLDLQRNSATAQPATNAMATFEWFRLGDNRLAALRESLRRTLLITLGSEKLAPLERSFLCLNRASKDLRNLFGLLGEASACIPVRTWDVRGTLRHFPADADRSPLSP